MSDDVVEIELADFLLNTGLYSSVGLNSCKEFRSLFDNRYQGQFHSYCPACGGDTTFATSGGYHGDKLTNQDFYAQSTYVNRTFRCRRDEDHFLVFEFYINGGEVEKIGQHPSVADLKFASLQTELNHLDPQDRREFATGVGLLSHGVGIGSYVYFRRILERQVHGVYNQNKNLEGWNDDEFKKMRMGERVQLVEKYLPDFFADHPVLYKVLSNGIHELDEATCLAHAPVLEKALEIILGEIEENRVKQKRRAEASASIKKLKLS